MGFTKTQKRVLNGILLDRDVISSVILSDNRILFVKPKEGAVRDATIYQGIIYGRWVDVHTTEKMPLASEQWVVGENWEFVGRFTGDQFRRWLREKA